LGRTCFPAAHMAHFVCFHAGFWLIRGFLIAVPEVAPTPVSLLLFRLPSAFDFCRLLFPIFFSAGSRVLCCFVGFPHPSFPSISFGLPHLLQALNFFYISGKGCRACSACFLVRFQGNFSNFAVIPLLYVILAPPFLDLFSPPIFFSIISVAWPPQMTPPCSFSFGMLRVCSPTACIFFFFSSPRSVSASQMDDSFRWGTTLVFFRSSFSLSFSICVSLKIYSVHFLLCPLRRLLRQWALLPFTVGSLSRLITLYPPNSATLHCRVNFPQSAVPLSLTTPRKLPRVPITTLTSQHQLGA